MARQLGVRRLALPFGNQKCPGVHYCSEIASAVSARLGSVEGELGQREQPVLAPLRRELGVERGERRIGIVVVELEEVEAVQQLQ